LIGWIAFEVCNAKTYELFMSTNVYKRFDPRVMEREERIGINRGLPTMPYWRSGISSTRERNSASFHSFLYAPLVKRRNFSHSWKKSQIFNRDSCKNLLFSVEPTYSMPSVQNIIDFPQPCRGLISYSLLVGDWYHILY
jgi:hypothetical protein